MDEKENQPNPEKELSAPHDMQLEEPHDMLLRPPTFWEKYHHIFRWLIPLIILVALGTVGVVYVEMTNRNNALLPSSTPTPQPSPTITVDPTADWQIYADPQYEWEIKHPADFTVRGTPTNQLVAGNLAEVNFQKVGKTQTEGTEFFDGLSFTVAISRKTASQTLEDFADAKTSQNPAVEKREYLREVTVNNLQGYEARINGLGTFDNIFIQHPSQENLVIWINYMTVGPDKMMFDKIVQQMLATLKTQQASPAPDRPDVPVSSGPAGETMTFCTMDAKVCPDGSSVGRTGPNCEFAACPGE